jgi:uncharacterized caspase-like protein
MTGSSAIIIGIDAYATQPLTSAVNDAQLFAKTLVDLDLVDGPDIRLLTAPSGSQEDLPTRKGILDALRLYYTGEKSADRLFVYYAGHGLLAFADAARALPRTALVPVDVRDLGTDGDLLIDLDSVVQRLRFSGPAEQFFFIDACRDLAYDEYPDATTALGWKTAQLGAERKQAILYAVPPLGTAQSERGGLGVMTRHLVDALHGRGIALDYSDDLRKYIVSPESVAAYVRKRVLETVGAVPLWQRNYVLPRLDHREPQTGPIREIDKPSVAHLTLYVRPQEAEARTRATLTQMDDLVCSWPPNSYGQPLAVKPRRYWLEADSDAGVTEPAERRIDAREEHEATIEIRPPTAERTIDSFAPEEPGPSEPHVEMTRDITASLLPRPEFGTIFAGALEPQSTVELEQIDPPYLRWVSPYRLARSVPPGAYRIRFRLGRDIFSESEIDVRDQTDVKVAPTIGSSPLIRDMFGAGASDMQVVISETIGPIQAGVLPTALSIIGVKPFDTAHELSGRFDGAVSLLDPKAFAMRPVSLVLSVDGNRWPLLAREVLRSARVTVDGPAGVAEIPVAPLLDGAYDGRVGLGVIAAPARSFIIRVQSPYIGAITLAAASMPKRVTVIALTFRPDGSFDMSQNLFPIPGLGYDKLATRIPYARMVRDLQLGQSLYESGELIERAGSSELLTDLLSAKRTDPVLSCMAAFAWSDTGQSGHDLLAATARNLRRYFGDLADAQVIQGLAFPTEREQSLSDALDTNNLPVLARSAAELARYAHERRRHDRAVVALSRRIRPGQSWLMNWQAGDGRTSAQ